MTISKSPDRNTFQKENYLRRQAEQGKTPENDEDTRAMQEYYESWDQKEEEKEADPKWYEYNLEADLRTTGWILEKVRNNEAYAQNLYAALCNTDSIKNDVWPILTEKRWSCSWRYAGGIIADMRQEGDYIDWYCSGIKNTLTDDELKELNIEQLERYEITKQFVGEGYVTDEVRADLLKLGWIVMDEDSHPI